MPSSIFTFDRQAPAFDRRAGLPTDVVREIAGTVTELASASTCPSSWLLDLGAGTGEIGAELAPRLKAQRLRYLGLDISLPMLRVSSGRLTRAALLRADADTQWPLRLSSLRAIFASRAAHLLRAETLASRALESLAPGGLILFGGVRRDPEATASVMRRQLHTLLAEHGVQGRRRGRRWRKLASVFSNLGCQTSKQDVASWQRSVRPLDSLTAWKEKDGLAGRSLPLATHLDVVERLERWAKEQFHDLELPRPETEHYEVLIVRRVGQL